MVDVSIVIISYNTLTLLRDCLQSVFENHGSLRTEVFVVDNASRDGSAQMVAEEFPSVRLIANAENRGFAAANNQAIRVATGRYVLLLNSDTRVVGEVLAKSVEYLDKHSDIGVLGCRALNPDGTMQLTCSLDPTLLNVILLATGCWKLDWPRWLGRYQMKHWARDTARDVPVVSGSYMMVRSEPLGEIGLLDESFFFFGEETDWCKRFRKAGWRVSFAPVGEYVHYGNASAVSLGHERDLLLTSALVRFHRKHGSELSAFIVWLVLLLFNLSRWILWFIVSSMVRTPEAKGRRDHFWGILRDYSEAWPRCEQSKS